MMGKEAIFKRLEERGGSLSEKIKKYLVDDSDSPYMANVFTYEALTWGEYKGLVEPLEFFNYLYAAYEFVKSNKATPLVVTERLAGMKLPDQDRHFFLSKLLRLILTGGRDSGNEQDKELINCSHHILEMFRGVGGSHPKDKEQGRVTENQNLDEEVEVYLDNDFNLEIYEDLTEGDNTGLFNPLSFLKTLHTLYGNVVSNRQGPLTFTNSIRDLGLSDEQQCFLLQHLNSLIGTRINELKGKEAAYRKKGMHFRRAQLRHHADSNEQEAKRLDICQKFIDKEFRGLHEKLFPDDGLQPREENRFDFDRVKQHLETLPDIQDRIRYLIEIMVEFKQQDSINQFPFDFEHKCNREIQKLRRLVDLDESNKLQTDIKAGAFEPTTRHAEFTTARQVLAIHYILEYCKVIKGNNADVARFIEFLTGKNYKNIYTRVCNPLGSRDKELNQDLRYVRDFFEKLGLTEIVKMINNEINSGSL